MWKIDRKLLFKDCDKIVLGFFVVVWFHIPWPIPTLGGAEPLNKLVVR